MNLRAATAGFVALLAATSTACGNDDDVADVQEAYCAAVVDAAAAARTVEGLTEESTVDDARQAVDDLQRSVDAAADAAQELGEADVDDLANAYDALRGSLDDLPASGPIGEEAAAVLDARNAFVLQWEGIAARNCGGALLPSTTTVGG